MSCSAERRAARLLLVSLAAALLCAVGPADVLAVPPPLSLGSGANEVWILRPTARVRAIVVFGHGWSTPIPGDAFAAWIAHLRSRGDLVIYPRYRESAADNSSSALLAFQAGVVAALRHLEPIRVPVLALGKSFGASAVFYYAAEAATWKVPGPAAVVSIFPAYPIGALTKPRDPAKHLRPNPRRRRRYDGGKRRRERLLELARPASQFAQVLPGHPLKARLHRQPRFRTALRPDRARRLLATHRHADRAPDQTPRPVLSAATKMLLTTIASAFDAQPLDEPARFRIVRAGPSATAEMLLRVPPNTPSVTVRGGTRSRRGPPRQTRQRPSRHRPPRSRATHDPVELAAVARDAALDARGRAPDWQIAVAAQGDTTVIVDGDALARVLRNLLDNAIAAVTSSGSIRIDVARNNGHVEARVTDTGPGVPQHERERIFERFVRLDQSTPGSGLGLAIARRSPAITTAT